MNRTEIHRRVYIAGWAIIGLFLITSCITGIAVVWHIHVAPLDIMLRAESVNNYDLSKQFGWKGYANIVLTATVGIYSMWQASKAYYDDSVLQQ